MLLYQTELLPPTFIKRRGRQGFEPATYRLTGEEILSYTALFFLLLIDFIILINQNFGNY
ncbi:hypothetical protein SAMN04488168_1823 [Bacillus sp. 491mf]|nr:hypothetical protein SAMN04488168_1823 [Bacillus sp. 491mf]